METLKKIVSNQYFPAAAVLTAVVLFWAVGLLGGLSLLHNNQPPLTTLTWMLFVYGAAVLTPLAGALAAVDLVRRWKRNRAAEEAYTAEAYAGAYTAEEAYVVEEVRSAEAGHAGSVSETQQGVAAPVATPAPGPQAAPDQQSAPGKQAVLEQQSASGQQAAPETPKKNAKQAGRQQAA